MKPHSKKLIRILAQQNLIEGFGVGQRLANFFAMRFPFFIVRWSFNGTQKELARRRENAEKESEKEV